MIGNENGYNSLQEPIDPAVYMPERAGHERVRSDLYGEGFAGTQVGTS
jgi:hypothetical protein